MKTSFTVNEKALYGFIAHLLQEEGVAYAAPLMEPAIASDGVLLLIEPTTEMHLADETSSAIFFTHQLVKSIAAVLRPSSYRASQALSAPYDSGTGVFFDEDAGWLRLSPNQTEQVIEVCLGRLVQDLRLLLDEADWDQRRIELSSVDLVRKGALTVEHLEASTSKYEKMLRDVLLEQVQYAQEDIDELEAQDATQYDEEPS